MQQHSHPIASPLASTIASPLAGTEWVVDAHGCDPTALRSLDRIACVCEKVIDDLGLQVIGIPLCHSFPMPGGVTAMYLLSESHLTCHTYPEFELATFNLYCCRSRPSWSWQQTLMSSLSAKNVLVRSLIRGLK